MTIIDSQPTYKRQRFLLDFIKKFMVNLDYLFRSSYMSV